MPPSDPRSQVNWAALAAANLTLVILMGVQNLPEIAAELQAHGLPADTPAAVVADGTTQDQLTLRAPLSSIADAAASTGIRPPAIVVIGAVAALELED